MTQVCPEASEQCLCTVVCFSEKTFQIQHRQGVHDKLQASFATMMLCCKQKAFDQVPTSHAYCVIHSDEWHGTCFCHKGHKQHPQKMCFLFQGLYYKKSLSHHHLQFVFLIQMLLLQWKTESKREVRGNVLKYRTYPSTVHGG